MLRIGIVRTQDASLCRVRVAFPDRDQLQSWWLPIIVPKTQNDKAYWIPDVGEQVVCLMDENDEEGAVVGAIYSAADATPVQNADKMHLGFKDGASLEYDRASHSLAINIPNGGALSISASGANIQIDSSGNVRIMAAGQIQLGNGELAAVARVGDLVNCPAGSGRIVSGSGSTYSA